MTAAPVVTLATRDVSCAAAFWDAVLGPLGWARLTELVDEEEDDAVVEAVGWAPDGAREAALWVVVGDPPTTGVHLRLPAAGRAVVETAHAAALGAGGVERAAPRRWTPYRRGEFAATVADRDGNVVEIVAPE